MYYRVGDEILVIGKPDSAYPKGSQLKGTIGVISNVDKYFGIMVTSKRTYNQWCRLLEKGEGGKIPGFYYDRKDLAKPTIQNRLKYRLLG